ncbi:hypothetical protein TCAL_16727 [Tigriopus californicus]|uniref:Uncharacterized protein n=1 Tax=Tigriopus californicus TaxID=6832 RepID=A0A553PK99_TIGCA|nr:hypothetical protein TCAL_16727 [Tigriopus californicus]
MTVRMLRGKGTATNESTTSFDISIKRSSKGSFNFWNRCPRCSSLITGPDPVRDPVNPPIRDPVDPSVRDPVDPPVRDPVDPPVPFRESL